ncbi:nuclease-related domain-containing protein [Cytobacillus pseudoceanisediminis]|uniref:nuclease-related domain-containing protein n=1 Tax=Cytobacillus pseudoceanisediminis TaxID=3051614 RepID=UPI0036532566
MISRLLNKLKNKNKEITNNKIVKSKHEKSNVAPTRIGDLGEYKVKIQLDQLPKSCIYLSDLLMPNPGSKTGYSQIDHIILSPYVIFVIETKNYSGSIYGSREKTKWLINGKFPVVNPFKQNFGHIKAVQSLLNNVDCSSIVSMVTFSRRCTFKVEPELRRIQSNELIVYDTELSDFITRKINVLRLQLKEPVFTEKMIHQMFTTLTKSNITDNNIKEQHIKNIKMNEEEAESNSSASCTTCGKMVSDKVRDYCLTNKERFNGSIYCFDHQREIL